MNFKKKIKIVNDYKKKLIVDFHKQFPFTVDIYTKNKKYSIVHIYTIFLNL